jgi:hypothetical protein
MWWLWAILILAVLMGIAVFLDRGNRAPNHQALVNHRRGDGGDGTSGSAQNPNIGGFGGGI